MAALVAVTGGVSTGVVAGGGVVALTGGVAAGLVTGVDTELPRAGAGVAFGAGTRV
jgi:hypothetical protein